MSNSNRTIKTIDDVILIPVLGEGEKLYHYTSAEGLKGICEKREFWATEGGFLNDFTEFKVASDIFDEILDRHMKDCEKCTKIKENVRYEVERLQATDLEGFPYSGDYVLSFCLDSDSPIMWSEYSGFTGYCMAFDFKKLVKAFHPTHIGSLHGRVVYDRSTQIELMEKAIERAFINCPQAYYLKAWSDFDNLIDKEVNDFSWEMAAIVSAYNTFFKLPCFEGENE